MNNKELVISYQQALAGKDKNSQNYLINALYLRLYKRLMTCAYRVWTRCRHLSDSECVGLPSAPGLLLQPVFKGLGLAAAKYDNVRPFAAYALKTVTGECYKYCIRECYIGRELLARLPIKLEPRQYTGYLNQTNALESSRQIFQTAYLPGRDGNYILDQSSLTIGKVNILHQFFKIHDQLFEESRIHPFLKATDTDTLIIDCIEDIINAINNDLTPRQLLLLLYFMQGRSQKQISCILRIPEVSTTREKKRLEKSLSLAVWKNHPRLLPDKLASETFDSFFLSGSLNLKEIDFISQCYNKHNNVYRLDHIYNADDAFYQKLWQVLYKAGYCRTLDLKTLRGIDYFRTRLQTEFPDWNSEHLAGD